MTARALFEDYFSEGKLKSIYWDYVLFSRATGIDNLSHQRFERKLGSEVQIIINKALSQSYSFTKYKLKLISKGRGKIPREISIPTIRDRIALRALCDFLMDCYQDSIQFQPPQLIVREIKDELTGTYDGFIKLDVENFYPSIKHDELIKRLRGKIRDPEILSFIRSAISTPTVARSKDFDSSTTIGVPQGLAVSNILSGIYLINIDRYLSGRTDISYRRYVDDVFIFCNYSSAVQISNEIIKRFSRIGLKIYDPTGPTEKSRIGRISESFDYLGYNFSDGAITAKHASVEKLKESLVSIFTSYKHAENKNEKFLEWRLNLRITGCIYKNKAKGWMFFYSEINNTSALWDLDRYVNKLLHRFNVNIDIKRFKRTYYEANFRKQTTTYIPNFDNFSFNQMRVVLQTYFQVNTSGFTNRKIEYQFKKRIDREVKDLETDVQDFS